MITIISIVTCFTESDYGYSLKVPFNWTTRRLPVDTVLIGWFSVPVSDVFSLLTKETEKYVNENSFIGNLTVLIYTYTLLFLQKYACCPLWSLWTLEHVQSI